MNVTCRLDTRDCENVSLINDITKGAEDLKDAAGQKIKEAREQIADATKPDEK